MSTEYVLPTVLDCAHVAQVITVRSGTYRKEQQEEVSSCYAHFMRELQVRTHICFKPFSTSRCCDVSHTPSVQIALGITVVSCSTHQQQFKQKPRSVERDKVRIPGQGFSDQNQQEPKREGATLRRTAKKKCRTWSYCRWYQHS